MRRQPWGPASCHRVSGEPGAVQIDPRFEEAAQGEAIERKETLKSKWTQLQVVVESENRIQPVARDLLEQFEKRLATMGELAL